MSENVWRAPGPGDSRAAANASYLPYQPPAEEEAEQRPPPGPRPCRCWGHRRRSRRSRRPRSVMCTRRAPTPAWIPARTRT